MITNNFIRRHNGPSASEIRQMLEVVGVTHLDELIDQTIPASIRLKQPLATGKGMNEYEYQMHINALGQKNKLFKTYIGLGYYNTILPGVIQRNILENPGWYTSYTPYQAEISQGRLEALLIFQTMVSDLTGLPVANASLLDEATAAAEAMIMFFNSRSREAQQRNARRFFVSETVFPQTLDVLKTRAETLGFELVIDNFSTYNFTGQEFGALVQYPDQYGNISNYEAFIAKARQHDVQVAVAADLMSLCLLTPPGEWGVDVALGTTQRFGIPMGFGGPHAAYFAAAEKYKRNMPGRIIGLSVDAAGNPALRMALQTREQHIKRERATSNICTAQALLAIMAGMYAVYHGPKDLKEIARNINILTGVLNNELKQYGYIQLNANFFDTLHIQIPENVSIDTIHQKALSREINFRYIDNRHIGISLDETTSLDDVNTILEVLATAVVKPFKAFVCKPEECSQISTFSENFQRKSTFLTHPVFNTYHSETAMMRFLKQLENKDLALNRTMIPLGSCTMKLNAASWMFALSMPGFAGIHPFVPAGQAQGYLELIQDMEKLLCEITGFAGISFQPNSGAQGEFTGLMVIHRYHMSRGEVNRRVCLIPSSAHGTNPASAVAAGMSVVVVKCDENGNIDIQDLKQKAEQYSDTLACIMVTYPSTHGVFEEGILEIVDIIHSHGGQVYMDGANMNAQVGLTSPGFIGADVCHLNLHKTFGIPHGGGGPGMGPIGVAKHLLPFLPGHVFSENSNKNMSAVSAAHFGSALVLPISYGYIKMLGEEGLTLATKMAILNANYLKTRLENAYPILYTGKNGRVAHEMILDCNHFSHTAGIQVIDIAKRLMDFGFHAPTVAFPVHGTLMVEPTESEPLSELERFVEAMLIIREEIAAIEKGEADKSINPVKKAPHTLQLLTAETWDLPYSREKAAFPVEFCHLNKYWPSVTRIDDAYGDRNLQCTCGRPEDYQ